jgi:GNAT superfamily N-acetyltransferase
MAVLALASSESSDARYFPGMRTRSGGAEGARRLFELVSYQPPEPQVGDVVLHCRQTASTNRDVANLPEPMVVHRNLSDTPYAVTIRPARPADLAFLLEIERAAGKPFRALGMDTVADDEPGTVEGLRSYAESGRAFVAVDENDLPVGYLLLDVIDRAAHVEQVSVHPTHARRGIGRALIEKAESWAVAHGLNAVTLTTYVDVPWNGPYYERLGFRYLSPEEETDGLRAIRDRERRAGLDAWPRACMSRRLN